MTITEQRKLKQQLIAALRNYGVAESTGEVVVSTVLKELRAHGVWLPGDEVTGAMAVSLWNVLCPGIRMTPDDLQLYRTGIAAALESRLL